MRLEFEILESRRVSHGGTHSSTDGPKVARVCNAVDQQIVVDAHVPKYPPILIGGGERGISPHALRRVIELGDGWIRAYLTPDEIADGVEQGGLRRQEGTLPSSYSLNELFTAVDRDSEKAKNLAAASLSTNFISVEEGEKSSLVGDPRQIADKLELYSRAGEDMVEMKWVYSTIPKLLEMMRLFKEEVVSSFS